VTCWPASPWEQDQVPRPAGGTDGCGGGVG
jgi:hypothetical protein